MSKPVLLDTGQQRDSEEMAVAMNPCDAASSRRTGVSAPVSIACAMVGQIRSEMAF